MTPRIGLRRVAFILAVFAAAAAGTSAAAPGGVTTGGLGAGRATLASCDSDGFTATPVLTGSSVTAVTVAGIDVSCGGGLLSLTVTDAGNASIASGGPTVVPPSTSSIEVVVAPTPDVSLVVEYHIVVVGP